MTSLFPSLFSQTSTEFTLAYEDPSVFSDRQGLFDSGADFYVKRTLTGTVNSHSRFKNFLNFPFTIEFVDACRSATLIDQTITFPDVTWNADLT